MFGPVSLSSFATIAKAEVRISPFNDQLDVLSVIPRAASKSFFFATDGALLTISSHNVTVSHEEWIRVIQLVAYKLNAPVSSNWLKFALI